MYQYMNHNSLTDNFGAQIQPECGLMCNPWHGPISEQVEAVKVATCQSTLIKAHSLFTSFFLLRSLYITALYASHHCTSNLY